MRIAPFITNPYTNNNRNSPNNTSLLRQGGSANSVLNSDDENIPQAGHVQPHADALEDGCFACENRKYQDVSSDGSVSMQTPTKLSPNEAAHQVAAHEREHLANDRADAKAEGREVVAQWMRLMNAICGECGRTYVAGGEAVTVSASRANQTDDVREKFNPGIEDSHNTKGSLLDTAA
jgi:hypothetical protein